MSTPRNFSLNLLDWTELELVPFKNGLAGGNETNPEMLRGQPRASVYEVKNICFPSGCVDPNDAGSLCCPF